MNRPADNRAVHKTVCSHDCPDACSVLVTVRDGRAVEFRGDPEHPVTQGFLCGKVGAYEETVHASDRLLHPLTSARLTDMGGGSTFHDNRVALKSVGER